MICRNCGAVLDDGAKFCFRCGVKLEEGVPNFVPTYIDPNAQANTGAPENAEANTQVPPIGQGTSQPNAEFNVGASYQNIPVNHQYSPYSPIPPAPVKDNSGFAIASLVLSIVGFVSCCFSSLLSILALIFGILGLKSSKRGLAIAGIIIAAVGLFLGIVITILSFIFEFGAEPVFSEFFDSGLYY